MSRQTDPVTGTVAEGLAPDLEDALGRLAELQALAGTPRQRQAVARASGRLLRAAADGGWPIRMLATAAKLPAYTARKRIRTDRAAHPAAGPGLHIAAPPARPHRAAPALDEKPWLRPAEVCALLGIYPGTLFNWRRAGLLPSTRARASMYLYAREDLIRLLTHRVLYHGNGIHYAATRHALALPEPTAGAWVPGSGRVERQPPRPRRGRTSPRMRPSSRPHPTRVRRRGRSA